MSMGEKNTKIFLQIFAFWMTVLFLALVFLTGCSEYSSDMGVTWSTSIQNLDGSNDSFVEDIPHVECHFKHYIDPYTEIEYCLPPGFSNMKNIHLYKVEK